MWGTAARYPGWVQSQNSSSPQVPSLQGSKGQPHLCIKDLSQLCSSSFFKIIFYFIIVFIFVASWLKSFSLIKDDSAPRVPGMA